MAERLTASRTVVGMFESHAGANRAVEDLLANGFTHEEIGVVAGHELSEPEQYGVSPREDTTAKMIQAVEKGAGLGGALGALAGGVSALLIPGVGPLVVGGALASAFLGAGLGAAAGGVMAGLMKAGVNESHARLFEAALRHGGVVVTVHTDTAHSRQAVEILDRHGALDMDEHCRRIGDRGQDHVPGSPVDRTSDTERGYSNPAERRNEAAEAEGMALDENARRLDPWTKHAAILGGGAGASDFENEYHQDFQNRYAGTGLGYERLAPAYALGEEYARDSIYFGRDWSSIEEHARRSWELRGHDTAWERAKDAVRHAWEKRRTW